MRAYLSANRLPSAKATRNSLHGFWTQTVIVRWKRADHQFAFQQESVLSPPVRIHPATEKKEDKSKRIWQSTKDKNILEVFAKSRFCLLKQQVSQGKRASFTGQKGTFCLQMNDR
ncbi:MAG: hypothetical protein PUK16_04860 [Prevotellaceae bacterium]|nr:hypothetical protein [Prevotellaceae bacterium]